MFEREAVRWHFHVSLSPEIEGRQGTRLERQKVKVAQNVVKHILVLEFFKSDEILEIEKKFVTVHKHTTNQTHRTL